MVTFISRIAQELIDILYLLDSLGITKDSF